MAFFFSRMSYEHLNHTLLQEGFLDDTQVLSSSSEMTIRGAKDFKIYSQGCTVDCQEYQD